MFRKYVIITLAAVLFLGTASCTSKKSAEETETAELSEDDSIESADATENNDDLDTSSSDSAVADIGSDEGVAPDESAPAETGDGSELAADDLSETPAPAEPTPDPGAPPSEMAATETPAGESSEPMLDTPSDSAAMDAPPPAEPETPATPEPSFDSPKPVASLQKVKTQPYKEGKVLVNAIYIAREGDSPETISQKVYGSENAKELCKTNYYNCSRPTKVGDKFYYNSPQRPNDDTVIKTFYEDAGIQPETYMAKAGDNIRTVGKELLGHERSWMELWSLNEVESKQELDEGTTLRYWPRSEVAAPAVAQTEAPPPADMAASEAPPATEPPPPMEGQPGTEPPPMDTAATQPPPTDMPQDSLPPSPDPNMAGSIEPPPPPPPPPPSDNMAQNGEMTMDGTDPDQTMALGVGAVLLLAAAALFISIRKKRQRRQIDFNTTTQTQIE